VTGSNVDSGWRCDDCGARNATGAGWCTQCFAAPRPASASPPEVTAMDAELPVPAVPTGPSQRDRDVRVQGDVVEWRCRACEAWNELVIAACHVCGSPRTGFATDEAVAPRRELSVGQAVAASLVVPGLAHVLVGRVGSGLARGLLAVGWGWIGLAVLLGPTGNRALGALLLAAGSCVYLGTAADARALVDPSLPVLLTPRRLAWGVAAVAVLLTIAAVATTLGGP
jgi:TM2 domain-containing membrane protein YozV